MVIRAIFFDFYSVWTPDKFAYYEALAEQTGPEAAKGVTDLMEKYYHGQADVGYVVSSLKNILMRTDIDESEFVLNESAISSEITNFMRELHAHFIKLGILGNLGTQEFQLLNNFNDRNQMFEIIASPLSLQFSEPLLSNQVFVSAMQAIGEPPNSCLLVSGNFPIIEFAASMGMATLQFEGLPKLERALQQVINSEIPGS